MTTLQEVIKLVNGENVVYTNTITFVDNPLKGDQILLGDRSYVFGEDIEILPTLADTLQGVMKTIPEVSSIRDNVITLTSEEKLSMSADTPARRASLSLNMKENFKAEDKVSVAGVEFTFKAIGLFGDEETPVTHVPLGEDISQTMDSFVHAIHQYQSEASGHEINRLEVIRTEDGMLMNAIEFGSIGNGIPFQFGIHTFLTKRGVDAGRIVPDGPVLGAEGGGKDISHAPETDREFFEQGMVVVKDLVCMLMDYTTNPQEDWTGARKDRKELKRFLNNLLEVVPSSANDTIDDRRKVAETMARRLKH